MTDKIFTHYTEIEPYLTKDGSIIRELMHPHRHAARAQSFAEAIVPVGVTTRRHWHVKSEEIYHIRAGEGRMTLGTEEFAVRVGDTVLIPPGTPHCIANVGSEPLHILCACSPAYSHDDTHLA